MGELTTECTLLLQAAIDNQENLTVILENNEPLLLNKSLQKFWNVLNAKELVREFGALEYRFVPHDSYFHAGKIDEPSKWADALLEIEHEDRIVSMINYKADPFAFRALIQKPNDIYTIVTFIDISQELIKKIMTENEVSLDKASGAYSKDYFTHTARSLQDAASYNKKLIAAMYIRLNTTLENIDEIAATFTKNVKNYTRQSDMIVRFDEKEFVILYLIDEEKHGTMFYNKMLNLIGENKLLASHLAQIKISQAIQKPREWVIDTINRAKNPQTDEY